jgi:serine/threonine protein kinase
MLPEPGFGYTIKERLGAGRWKEAFRAFNASHGRDVALVFFRDKNENRTASLEGSKLMSLAAQAKPFSEYIAGFYGSQIAPDGRIFFVEELISNPLDRISPVRSMTKFSKYARDLCRGLSFLHSNKLVHRDLKLDNCGLSFGDRVKIFDIGSVTSENGEVKGTILTRAPELFQVPNGLKQKDYRRKKIIPVATQQADIWAAGATIFALRNNTYPFVLPDEISARRRINDNLVEQLSTERDKANRIQLQLSADSEKAEIDEAIARRVFSDTGKSLLFDRIDSEFKGKPAEILKSMLQFDPKKRRSAAEYASDWDAIFLSLETLHRDDSINIASTAKISSLLKYAERVSRGDVIFPTDKQLQRLHEDLRSINSDNKVDSEMATRIKRLLVPA